MYVILLMQWLAPLAVVGGIALMAGAGIVYKEDIKALLHAFIRVVDRCDPPTHQAAQCPLGMAACACSTGSGNIDPVLSTEINRTHRPCQAWLCSECRTVWRCTPGGLCVR